ncbi:hypothetical protein AB1Y20_003834 [Prymnesium parvum]|uniref:Inositol-pentakisphosphate 2-kinase n=1 Tax=Prymnesium parvum TaxID=97485 RepID=A0AB34J5S4_PRYPA
MEPLSCGRQHAVWRLLADGRVLRVPRAPPADRTDPTTGAAPLRRLLGRQYVHFPLAERGIDAHTARLLHEAAAAHARGDPSVWATPACAVAVERLLAAPSPPEPGQLRASLEVDHSRPPRGAGVCVELKPKGAVLPGAPLSSISPARCRHCLYVRRKEAALGAARTDFCPLDLFAPAAHRRAAAVRALVATPHNNLKLFDRTGALRFGGARGDDRAALHAVLARELPDAGAGAPRARSARGGAPRLQPAPAAQCKVGSAGAMEHYARAIQILGEAAAREAILAYLAEAGGEGGESDTGAMEAAEEPTLQQCIATVGGWLLALTASDVSLMIALGLEAPLEANPKGRLQSEHDLSPGIAYTRDGVAVEYRIGVVDVQPKSCDKVREHYDRDTRLVQALQAAAEAV